MAVFSLFVERIHLVISPLLDLLKDLGFSAFRVFSELLPRGFDPESRLSQEAPRAMSVLFVFYLAPKLEQLGKTNLLRLTQVIVNQIEIKKM